MARYTEIGAGRSPGSVPAPLRLADGRSVDFDALVVMGVLNITPDSFSDGGRYGSVDAALARAEVMMDAGAHIIDVGGESTRPGATRVSAKVQIQRVVPVIAAIAGLPGIVISADTTDAAVARAALGAGAHLINDISAFRYDRRMLRLLAETGVPAVAMHTAARSEIMQDDPQYGDVVEEVLEHLEARLAACTAAGVVASQIVIDPGIGFGKTLAHNLALLHATPRFVATGQPVLVGVSNKRFIGELTGRAVQDRLMGTAGACAAAVVLGAQMLRVHDVVGLGDALRVAGAIARPPIP